MLVSGLQAVEGRIVRTADCCETFNSLYFDGRPVDAMFIEWNAFVIGRKNSFAIGTDFVFLAEILEK